MTRAPVLVTAALAASLAAGDALGSGILVARFGGEHGHPMTDNPTAIYYNPAGLSLGKGLRLFIDGSLAWRSFTYDRPAAAIDTILEADGTASNTTARVAGTPGPGHPSGNGIPANSGEGSLFNIIASPFAAVVYDFGLEGFGAGIGFYAPFGGQSIWDEQEANPNFPGADDGPQRWWVIEGTIRSLYFTAAAGYEIPKTRLSLGFGVNAVKSEIHTVRARVAGSAGDHLVKDDGSIAEGRARVDVSSWDISVSAGLLYEAIPDALWLGLSYQSQPGFGKNKLSGDGETVTYTGGKANITPFDATVEQEMPDVVRGGGRWRPTKDWEVRLFGEYVRWSVFDEQPVCNDSVRVDTPKAPCESSGLFASVARDWEDAFGIRAGGSYFVTPDIEVYLGAGYDANAVPDETVEPALYDAEKFTAAAGAKFALLDDALAIAATYTQVIYIDRSIDPRPRLADGSVDYAAAGIDSSFGSPDAAGDYSQAIGLLNVNVEYRF